jgi:hypothetical protein
MRNVLIILIILSLIVSGINGCEKETSLGAEDVKNICIDACKAVLAEGQNLSVGPCLLNPIPNTDYVCDIAHSPRQEIDNLPENQCSSFREGKAKHFIEVTPECKFIKAV